jgi:hypothetical protein
VWEELLRLVLQATYTEWRKDRHVFELIWQHAFGVGATMVKIAPHTPGADPTGPL